MARRKTGKIIVSYVHEYLGISQLRFEPASRLPDWEQSGFSPALADSFVEHFLAAQQQAHALGCQLSFSGVRLDEIHGPYCDVLRDVLRLTPDGRAIACFLPTDMRASANQRFAVGHLNNATGDFVLDSEGIAAFRLAASLILERCHECVNAYHCARHCPDACYDEAKDHATALLQAAAFRCRLQQQLAHAWILAAGERLVAVTLEQTGAGSAGHSSADDSLTRYLKDVSPLMDVDEIVRQWQAVKHHYSIEQHRMPSPIWMERGFEHNGLEAWRQLSRDILRNSGNGPMSIYIHIPFCAQRCGFCDCYSLALGKNQRQQEYRYLTALSEEIQAWSAIQPLNQRPVTTVHFGGGTPNYLSPAVFESILNQCRSCFAVHTQTEWALESTTTLLTDEHLACLREWGFTRLHVGVQTLEDGLRALIDRQEKASTGLKKLAAAVVKGFITSVDVIYGLPGQPLSGLVDTLERLIQAGIHGISLYRFNISKRNRRFATYHQTLQGDAIYDYVLFQVAEQILIRSGYRKNHFAHFARPQDHNLYYTHSIRGEDLLAIGATADGVFSDYHYRHPDYKPYITKLKSEIVSLEGGIRESALEWRIRPIVAALMGGCISMALVQDFQISELLCKWLESTLLRQHAENETFILTGNGSWMIDSMISELAVSLK